MKRLKIWLDDQCYDKDCPARFPPTGYIGITSVYRCCSLIQSNVVEYIDFDHDLGEGFPRQAGGYLVARYIEKLAFYGKISPIDYDIHSANPIGAENIRRAMQSAERFWRIHPTD